MSTAIFSRQLLDWYTDNGRRDLPWQTPNPYHRWLSEIMLQQTQVTTVIPYFQRFIKRFPDIHALAGATIDEVLHLWSGLGYYARARNLHRAAGIIVDRYNGVFPDTFAAVCDLPGIGRSTAGAILVFAYGQRHPILDGNVKRVLTRFHAITGWPGKREVEKRLWELADRYTPATNIADYTQAVMDFGATVCTRHQPGCENCPVAAGCRAYQQDNVLAYPEKAPKKSLPCKTTAMLLIRNSEGHILLQQRPPSGIWGGLWSLPECPDADIEGWCRQSLGLEINSGTPWPKLRHSFTHFHLEITPIPAKLLGSTTQIMEPDSTVWYNLTAPDERGLATPVRCLLDQLRQQS